MGRIKTKPTEKPVSRIAPTVKPAPVAPPEPAAPRQRAGQHARPPAEQKAVQTARQSLVAQLIEQCCNADAEPPRHTEDGSQVLLDIEQKGFRCIVLREPPRHGKRVELTPREHEVARMVAQGYPNKTIARVLEISQWTVGTYLRRVFAKLNVNSRAAMVRRLLEEHLLDGD